MATTRMQWRSGGKAAGLDPRLQRIAMQRRYGVAKAASSSTGTNEVAVVARVTSVDAWKAISEVHFGEQIGDKGADDEGYIVTGRIPVRRISEVRAQDCVLSLKAAQRVRRTLAQTTVETGTTLATLPPTMASRGGAGVLVGIVDFGCDFAHRNFSDPVGRTRIHGIWDQRGTSGGGSVAYGTLHTRASIDGALASPAPYQTLRYAPSPVEPAHGTHVMDIAAGNGHGTGIPGMAPEADIAFVELASTDIPWEGPDVVEHSFGDSVQLLEAVKWLFDLAGPRPCVVNLSLGTNGGPHDGTTLVEQGLDRLVAQAPNRAVVIAASNAHDDGIHASGTVSAQGSYDLSWEISSAHVSEAELEIWYDGASQLTIEISDPSGQPLGTVAPGESASVAGDDGEPVVFVASRLNDPNNGANQLSVWLGREAPAGAWRVRLVNAADTDVAFHAWIERDDRGQSHFGGPLDNTHTLGSISCGAHPIVVASYDAHKPTTPISWFSSAGPTRKGGQKPDVSAPGHDVVAARSRSVTGVTRMSGTSMAAPAVTGLVALLLAEAKARNKSLTHQEIRAAIISTARPMGAGGAWDARYGAGRVSGSAIGKVIP